MKAREFDYVIVGAGSAGCALASRLSEDPSTSVLILEAGSWDRDPLIKIPLAWGSIFKNRYHDWMYDTEPEPNINGRRIEFARGKVVGGSSSVNAMAYVRGHRGDYDRWEASGLTEWSYQKALPYFRRQESWEGGESTYRGGTGPLSTRFSTFTDPLVESYLEAAERAAFPFTPDFNGVQQEGFGRSQSTISKGLRCSAATAYLHPARSRSNLTIEVGALATRILFEKQRATGIEYLSKGETKSVLARREVLICGGVVNSPQLLMLSGIGDPDHLAEQDIPVRISLPGVGKNLQDHISALVAIPRSSPGTLHRTMRIDRAIGALAQAYVLGKGPATDLPGGVSAFLKTRPDAPMPDVPLLLAAGPMTAAPYLEPFRSPYADGFAVRVVLLRPESRGQIKLGSKDPRASAKIYQNFLSHDHEWKTLRAGLRIVGDLTSQPSLNAFIKSSAYKPLTSRSDADLDDHIRKTAITVHHPLGTCKMGLAGDPTAVVDQEMRVHGTEGLRVVDASVMPDLIGGNINATVIMMAEKVSDVLRNKTLLPPANI